MLGGEAKNAATQFRPSSPSQLGTNNAVRILSTNLRKREKNNDKHKWSKRYSKVRFYFDAAWTFGLVFR